MRTEMQRGFDRIEGVTRIEAEAGRQVMAQVRHMYSVTIFFSVADDGTRWSRQVRVALR